MFDDMQWLNEPPSWTSDAGIMCCAPVQSGFEARFEDFAISEPISRDLHE